MSLSVSGIVAAAIALFWTAALHAAGLSVTPTGLRFEHGESVQSLIVANTGEVPLRVQLRAFVWSQPDGEDRLEPGNDFVISPPMFEVAAGRQQFVRVVRRAQLDGASEHSYRLLVDELPDPTESAPQPGLTFVMRYSLPLFVAPAAAGDAALAWQGRLDGTTFHLRAHNQGQLHAKVIDLELRDATGRQLLTRPGLLGYVLPGAHRTWQFELDEPATTAVEEIRVRVNGQDVGQTIMPERSAR